MRISQSEASLLDADDLELFASGAHLRLYEKLGAHPMLLDGESGTYFAVWAPNASAVSVIGDFNGWQRNANPLRRREASGLWEGFTPGASVGALYKFHVVPGNGRPGVDKADPCAALAEESPRTGSRIWSDDYSWGDAEWIETRARRMALDAPMSIYELHLGSWRRSGEGEMLGYRDLTDPLVDYIREMGFTHVEFLPLTEHPFYGSWGYQTTGYFAPTSRYGSPQELMAMIDALHRAEIGVIMDWVPSHFPADEHGLREFDGTPLYEHGDPRRGYHPDWNSCIFDYGRNEVRSFLSSSAALWFDRFHVDALRVDAVSSMLYLDYSRKPGEWEPNLYGGRENLEAMSFLRQLNERLYLAFPDTQTIAEESTAWPQVSRPTTMGGLGFGLKWDMGWMHDSLDYLSKDAVYRRHHHDALTFRQLYAYSENFVLPLSHDEVVHGKGSLLAKMPGDDWQKRANLRALLAYQYTQPGKKLLFMGGEFGQWAEWKHDSSLDWHLLDEAPHRGVQRFVRDLNECYRANRALYEIDCDRSGFTWIDCEDAAGSTLAYLRRGRAPGDIVLAVFNFTPVPRHDHRVGVPLAGYWREILNSDASVYGGSGMQHPQEVKSVPTACHGQQQSISLSLPPLGAVIWTPQSDPAGFDLRNEMPGRRSGKS